MDGFPYTVFPGFRQDLGEPNNTASLQLFRFDSPKNRPTESCGLGFTRPRCRGKIDDVTTQGNQILKEMAHEKTKNPPWN